MENPKMQSLSRCNKRTGIYGPEITRLHASRRRPIMEIWENSKLSKTMVPPMHQRNVYNKKWLWVWTTQKCNRFLGAINALNVTARKLTRFHAQRKSRECKFGNLRSRQKQWYRLCTKAMFISNGSCGYGEPKNAIAFSVQ